MKPVDWVILGIVLLCVGAAVFFLMRRRKRGGSCCGDCSACGGSCSCEQKTDGSQKNG